MTIFHGYVGSQWSSPTDWVDSWIRLSFLHFYVGKTMPKISPCLMGFTMFYHPTHEKNWGFWWMVNMTLFWAGPAGVGWGRGGPLGAPSLHWCLQPLVSWRKLGETDVFRGTSMGGSINGGTPKWWLIMENTAKIDDLGVPLFQETTKCLQWT